ncbi:hypothetical protein F0P96_06295 [Hymenobacter busanensis]|uniref:Uncharacterized protein n=1 Tax=Hymenobacter busanensis TaxID=2607656 RepID=A0A7L5A030_9BACT|nr:restriction endonuclease subunit S [Hymenobacter busanensis]KAA9338439.1 hypothetical protein F0P96_06295 [Hymenobacter busanensis]QHJ09134.1 hypothetical protein GUY19_18310 [Hymenobacter busanensis]
MPNLLETLDKSDWQTFRFDEIAHNISKRVEPGATDLTIYVGLEHLDSGSLHIKRKGTPADVDGIKLLVYAGDVIFGRRRAYQRKAAVATFDGICSAHAMVLRAKPDVIEPRLFPFFLHSDAFMHRVVDISVGGLSPTVNWGHLKVEEFLLPPRDQQARLAELLWAADEVGEKQRNVLDSLRASKKETLRVVFEPAQTEQVTIEQIAVCLDSKRKPVKKSDRSTGIYPYYGASGVVDYVDGFLYNEPILLVSEDGENLSTRNLDIAYEVDEKCWVNNHAHVLRITDASRYLVKEYFNHSDISDYVSGSTRPKLNKSTLMEMSLFLPPKEDQPEVELKLKRIDKTIEGCEASISQSDKVKTQLINQIFSA